MGVWVTGHPGYLAPRHSRTMPLVGQGPPPRPPSRPHPLLTPPEKAGVCKWEGQESLRGGGHNEPHNEELTVVILCWSLSPAQYLVTDPIRQNEIQPHCGPWPGAPGPHLWTSAPSAHRGQAPRAPLPTSALSSCREQRSLRQPPQFGAERLGAPTPPPEAAPLGCSDLPVSLRAPRGRRPAPLRARPAASLPPAHHSEAGPPRAGLRPALVLGGPQPSPLIEPGPPTVPTRFCGE